MKRCKNLVESDHIANLEEWFQKCPPTGKEVQWKDGRSAKETAKHWVDKIPQPFIDILMPLNLKFNVCSPEYVTAFDANGGNGRNHDLLILAENENKECVVISIESKADEPFGDSISTTINKAMARKREIPNSKGLIRIAELRNSLFGKEDICQLDLRYQLLTAITGTIAEAKKHNAVSAIFLIQTFVSDNINNKKHKQNQLDLDTFIQVFSDGIYTNINDNELIGPLRAQSKTNYIPDDIDLWIGKFEIEI